MARPEGKVLYVDDEESNLTVFEAAFEDVYDVRLAASGEQALAMLRQSPVEVVVTDMRMPGMSGVELLERIIPEWPESVRIVLTGYTDLESVVRAINRGHIYQYVTKPWDERDVRQILDRALARYRAGADERRLRAELDALARKEAAIRSVFQRYVPPEVVDRVFEEHASPRDLTAHNRDVVLMFADLRGFTDLCGRVAPTEVLRLMNEYFSVMTELINQRGGTVSAYLGDAIVAVFDPSNAEDEDVRAVVAALDMVEALAEFNSSRAQAVWPPGLRFGIGIQRGRVTTGEVGSEDARTMAVVGDAYFQVKEIEEHSKAIANSIIVSEDVVAHLRDGFHTVAHGTMTLGDRQVGLSRVIGQKGRH
jgi:adenylate cyclase